MDSMESLRVITHNTIKYLALGAPFFNSKHGLDREITLSQINIMKRATVGGQMSFLDYRDLVEVFGQYWKQRGEFADGITAKLPSEYFKNHVANIQNILLQCMRDALRKNVELAELISFCRAYEELLVDLLDVPLNWINAMVNAKRAVLVIFDTEETINSFKQQFGGKLDRLHVLTINTNPNDKERLITESGVSRTITLATREMGRGVDYKSSVTVEKKGGVHVIQTFFSLDVKEETQIKGRTARKDHRGSYEMILCYVDLKGLNLKDLIPTITTLLERPALILNVLRDAHSKFLGYELNLAGFVGFLWYNGSIVVGDKTAHVAAVHLSQIFYFSLFFAAFSSSHVLGTFRRVVRFALKRWYVSCFCVGLFLCVIQLNTIVHPYLLADNRHYTFYIWMRFYQRWTFAKFLPVPIYYGILVLLGLILFTRGQGGQTVGFSLLWMLATLASVALQQLIEVRSTKLLALEVLANVLINAATFYIFCTKAVYWSDYTEPQRIIW
ncbi:hypothetical protein quinque_001524 [Culex quinquefasciatus]